MLKKLLVLCALALCMATASAQAPRQACHPLINGYPASPPLVAAGDVGTHIYWACSDAKGAKPRWYGLSCLHSVCSLSALGDAIERITRASARVGTTHAEWDKAVNFSCTAAVRAEQNERGALCRERQALLGPTTAGWLD